MFGTPASMLSISFPAAALSLMLSLFGEEEQKSFISLFLRTLTVAYGAYVCLRSNTIILKKRIRGIWYSLEMQYQRTALETVGSTVENIYMRIYL